MDVITGMNRADAKRIAAPTVAIVSGTSNGDMSKLVAPVYLTLSIGDARYDRVESPKQSFDYVGCAPERGCLNRERGKKSTPFVSGDLSDLGLVKAAVEGAGVSTEQ